MLEPTKDRLVERLERVRSQRNPQEKFLARIKIKVRKVGALGEHHHLPRREGK